jgi:Flp pilus assembly pilin Flp
VVAERSIADQGGATAVEYGLILALIAGAIAGTVFIYGQEVLGLFITVDGAF